MKQQLLIILIVFSSITSIAQTVAYDATFTNYNHTNCIDLTYLNATVKGHQINFLVEYFATLSDAQNQLNKLPVYYSYSSDNETLYARVINPNNSNFATSEISIVLSNLTTTGPPPTGQYTYQFCDVDNNGEEVAYLEPLSKSTGLIYNSMFCNLFDSEISYSYHLSNQDAIDEVNVINEIYTFSQDTHVYCKVKNSVNSETFIYDFILEFTACTAADDDADGIDNRKEDANRNGNIYDDDTDNDGLKNFEDADDDGDTILTINEDYNNNGSALDDDTNANGIADYLELSVTLSTIDLMGTKLSIYPNPVSNILNIELDKMTSFSANIIDVNGKIMFKIDINETHTALDISNLAAGIYFLKLNTESINDTYKFIKK